MQTKTLSERIEKLQIAHLYDDEATIDDAIEIIRDLQAELKNENDFKNCFRYHNERLILENEALLAKNKELEEELQERKAYIVANPCAQCGGRINAMKCDAWAKKAKELEEKVEMQRDFMIELEIELLAKGIGCKKFEEILEKLDKQGE